jgi:hemerythrin-like domain-containing protein
MVHYLDAYPEKRHHPKEDQFIFALLKQRTAEGAEAIARLEEEHARGNDRIKALDAAVQRYADGAPGAFEDFVAAFEAFAAFYREHMMREEREILPLVHKYFTAEDWAIANAGFAGTPDPMSGTRTADGDEDFRRLFSRLVAATPAPLGLGGGPYKDD